MSAAVEQKLIDASYLAGLAAALRDRDPALAHHLGAISERIAIEAHAARQAHDRLYEGYRAWDRAAAN